MGKNDRFAAIAASGIATAAKGLITPHVRKPNDHKLPWNGHNAPGEIFVSPKTPAQEVQAQMEALRQQYAPFMQSLAPAIPSRRTQIPLTTFQWRIAQPWDKTHFPDVLGGAGQWQTVTIPHYGGPLGKAETIYRTTFELESLPAKNEALFLHFNGVDYKTKAFLNGYLLGSHEGMFAPFEFDCTESLLPGTNTLVVCVENDYIQMGGRDEGSDKPHTGDKIYAATGPGYDDPQIGWHHCPPGMGIYQEVYLELRQNCFVHDVYALPKLSDGVAQIHIETYQCFAGMTPITFQVSVYGKNFTETVVENHEFVPQTSREVGLGDTFTQAQFIELNILHEPVMMYCEKGLSHFQLSLPIPNCRIWDPEHPWLYEVQVRLLDADGNLLDARANTFGMRSFEMDMTSPKKGMMYLNGKKVRLRGANTMGFEQQDVMKGDLDQLVEDILLAKACNMNFLRITQRPVQDIIYRYCDMLGLMIQTDLPMFGVVRRNQFAEAIRQASEMERLVRSHPCVILDTYINEPFPNAENAPHRNLTRPELMAFFEAADRMIHLENPDRVIKHVDGDYDPPSTTLPDNHCYCCWYNGHGVDAGALYKGDWIPVNDGWYYGCGEFGAEGLEEVSVMRKYYPKQWLPQTEEEEALWSPNSIVGAQTGNFHYFFYDTPNTLEQWVAHSQEYQAEATKWMTETFRRNADMVSFALHLFIDAFPSGWMKTIVDVDRNLKQAFFAYRDALNPLLVSLRTDRFTYFGGENANVEVWLCNDLPEALQDATVVYEAHMPDGQILRGTLSCDIAGCDVTYAGALTLPVPAIQGTVEVRCAILDSHGKVLHRNTLELYSYLPDPAPIQRRFAVLNQYGQGKQLAEELQLQLTDPDCADCILIDEYSDFTANRAQLEALAKSGKDLVFLELPADDYDICGQAFTISQSSMMPMHFVSRNTGHPWVQGFDRKAFRNWYDPSLDQISPILETTFTSAAMTPVLTSGNTDPDGNWETAMAVGEMGYGDGRVVICQLKLAGRVKENPVAWIFARRMLSGKVK